MLLTNGGASARELYTAGFLTTVTAILNMSASKSPMGVALVTIRTRFAGLHRPDPPVPRSISLSVVKPAPVDKADP